MATWRLDKPHPKQGQIGVLWTGPVCIRVARSTALATASLDKWSSSRTEPGLQAHFASLAILNSRPACAHPVYAGCVALPPFSYTTRGMCGTATYSVRLTREAWHCHRFHAGSARTVAVPPFSCGRREMHGTATTSMHDAVHTLTFREKCRLTVRQRLHKIPT